MFGRRKKQGPESAPVQSSEPAPARPGEPVLPGLAGYIHQGKLPRGKKAMPPNRFNYKRPDGRPD